MKTDNLVPINSTPPTVLSFDPSLQPRVQTRRHPRIQTHGQLVDALGKDRWVDQAGLEHGRRKREVFLPMRDEFGNNTVVCLQKDRPCLAS